MNILYITKYSLNHGGVFEVLKNLEKGLKKHHINVIFATSSEEISSCLNTAFSCKLYSKKKLDILRNKKKLNSLIKKYNIKLIHAHGYTSPSLSAYKLSLKYKIPYICTSHGEINRYNKSNSHIEKEYRQALNKSNFLTVLNTSASITARNSGISNKNLKVIPNGINQRKRQINDKNYILSFTDFSKIKRSELLIEGYINSSIRKTHALILAGKRPPPQYIEDNTNKANINIYEDPGHLNKIQDNSIYFPGYIQGERKWQLIDNCSAYAASSEAEGFGLAVLEAAYANKKLLLSNIPSFQEFSSEFNAYLVKGATPDAWTESLNNIQSNKAKEFPAKFLWPNIIQEYVDIYKDVIG